VTSQPEEFAPDSFLLNISLVYFAAQPSGLLNHLPCEAW
jgi:hypothetical protein